MKKCHSPKCIDCGKALKDYRSVRCHKCMGVNRKGIKNPNWKGGFPKCTDCGKELKDRSSVRCPSCAQLGEQNTMWGKIGELSPSYIPNIEREYPPTFNDQLRAKVRVRDNFICQLCGVPEIECSTKLDVHHKDYEKKNNKINNLIALCHSCHSKTRTNREYWKDYFQVTQKVNQCLKT